MACKLCKMDIYTQRSCLCLELAKDSEGNNQWFPVLSACLEHILSNGLTSKSSVLRAENPLVATCCKLAGAHPPPEVDKLKLGEESLYFQPERVPSSGSRRSASSSCRLKVVQSGDNQDLSQHLLYACAHGLKDAVQLVLNSSHDIDLNSPLPLSVDTDSNEQGLTPLTLAALSDTVVLCTLLVKGGAGVNATDSLGRSSLHWAVLGGCLGTVNALLKLGADTGIVDTQGFTPLHYGCIFGLQNVVSALLKEGSAQVDQPHKATEDTPLMFACMQGHVDISKLLLKHHANPLLINNQGLTPLHCGLWGGNVKCVKTILGRVGRQGLNCQDEYGRSPLHIAATKGDPSVCQLLLKKGAALSEVDNEGRTVLHWAVISREVSCVEFLLEHQDVVVGLLNKADHFGATPVHYAAMGPADDILLLLKAKGANLSYLDSKGCTPLLWAAAFGCQTTVKLFLPGDNDGDNPSHPSDGFEPLHAASSVGATEVCQLLVDHHNESVHASTVEGYTPLHYASRFGHTACVQLLLTHGARVDALTAQKETSLHLASMYGHAQIAQELMSKNASQDKPLGDNEEWPVHIACSKGYADVLDALTSHSNDSTLLDQPRRGDNLTPLQLAASSGHLPCCKLLISRGCNISATVSTIEGHTALDLAMINGHTECADYLMSCHVPSGGGIYHRAVATIQAAWKYHRYKVRRGISRRWSAVVIQRVFRQWLRRRCAVRVRQARQRHRNRAALIIQTRWNEFIKQKRRYEASYAQLKSRLYRETLATTLILSELHLHAQSVRLPPPVATRSKSFTTTTVHNGPSPKYLFQASSNPAPIFPSGSLLFPAKPRKPLVTIAPPSNANKYKHSNPITSPPSHLITIKETTPAFDSVRINSGEKVRFPPVTVTPHSLTNTSSHKFVPVTSLTSRVSPKIDENQSKPDTREPTTSIEKLPKLPKQNSLVSVCSDDIDTSHIVSQGQPVLQDSSQEAKSRSLMKKTSSSIKLPSQAQLKLSRMSVFKDTPLKCRPTPSHASTNKSERGLNSESMDDLELPELPGSLDVGDEEAPSHLGRQDDDHDRSWNGPAVSGQLLTNIQRYDKLNEVLTLLHQAKDAKESGIEEGNDAPVKMNKLKEQIMTALDEAVRLRAETEAMQQRVEVKPQPVNASSKLKT